MLTILVSALLMGALWASGVLRVPSATPRRPAKPHGNPAAPTPRRAASPPRQPQRAAANRGLNARPFATPKLEGRRRARPGAAEDSETRRPIAEPYDSRSDEQRQIRQLTDRLARLEAQLVKVTGSSGAAVEPALSADDRHRVIALAERGKRAADIARDLGMSQSEVDVIVRMSQPSLAVPEKSQLRPGKPPSLAVSEKAELRPRKPAARHG